MNLLAGDIGGTSSRFQWYDTARPDRPSSLFCYPSARYSSFSELLADLLAESGVARVDVACFGVAGPVGDGEVTLTNLPWSINIHELKHQLPLQDVTLINDFHAAALGIDSLNPCDLVCLHPGDYDPRGNRLVIGAGTGLGVEPVCQIEGRFYPQPSEGGHMAFAPQNDEQNELLAWMQQETGHVTYEHLLSGDGLEKLYHFHCRQRGGGAALGVISGAGVYRLVEANDAVAVAALRCFVNIYAQFIADAVLMWHARAGIYIAGGIAAKIVRWMQGDDFTRSFLAEKPLCEVVRNMPVYLVKDELLGLKGALLMAHRMAGLSVD